MRREMKRSAVSLRSLFIQPDLFRAAMVALGFLVVTSALVVWSREQSRVYPGQVMAETRIKRLDFEVPNYEQTELNREAARAAAPLVYTPNVEALEALRSALLVLPTIVAPQTSTSDIVEKVRVSFALDDEAINRLREYAFQESSKANWKAWVTNLVDEQLLKHPLVDSQEWQLKLTMPTKPILRDPSGKAQADWVDSTIRYSPDAGQRVREDVQEQVLAAGFPETIAKYVTARIVWDLQPTYVHSESATRELAGQLAAQVPTEREVHGIGEVIYKRGDVLSERQLHELNVETASFADLAPWVERWTPRIAIIGLLTIIIACPDWVSRAVLSGDHAKLGPRTGGLHAHDRHARRQRVSFARSAHTGLPARHRPGAPRRHRRVACV